MSGNIIKTDCGVIGGGLGGCSVALELANAGKKVDLFVKGKLIEDGNSYLLAGGYTAVSPYKEAGDSLELHVKDTLGAGKNLNDKKIVEFCAENFFPEVIQWMIDLGVEFDKSADGKGYDLHREGGHSKNRIFHVRDTTGKSTMEVLGKLVRSHPNITVHENTMTIDVVTNNKFAKKKEEQDRALGFYVYDIQSDKVVTVMCKGTFVATGGLGKVFLYTSNSDQACGDGFAMAYRLGLKLANMEFIQFHPTVFYDPSATHEGERRFLLTEALRGAGAFLKLSKNSKEDFVLKYDPLGSRATRDVVSRAEDVEMRKSGLTNVWLDCTKIDAERLRSDFKNSYEFCLSKGYDLTKEPVPVVYAEHYSNGGVLVGKNSGTAIGNLYVVGETSYTGLHGATRLASNSGPECVLFGKCAARDFLLNAGTTPLEEFPLWNSGSAKEPRDRIAVEYFWDTIRRTMNSLCGMSRNEERLKAARDIIKALQTSINEYYWNYKVSKDFLEVRNIADAALVVVESALARKETRACHCSENYPETNDKLFLGITVIDKGQGVRIEKIK